MSENDAGGTVETPSVEELQARLSKAEAKIVDLKKNTTSTNTEEVTEDKTEVKAQDVNPDYMTRADYDAEQFFKSNPDLAVEKDFIMEKVKLGNSFEDAKWLAEKKDPTIYNKQKTNSMSMSWEAWKGMPLHTIQDLEQMSQKEYNQATDMIAAWTAELVS